MEDIIVVALVLMNIVQAVSISILTSMNNRLMKILEGKQVDKPTNTKSI